MPPLPRIREWRVHLGAHKTATTHLQSCLAAQRAEMAAAGTTYLPLETVRPILARGAFRRHRWRRLRRIPGLHSLFDQAEALSVSRRLRRCMPKSGPLVFSEEDLLGFTSMIFDGRLYPDLAGVERIARMARSAPLKLFMAVRCLDSFLPSAYAEALKGHPGNRTGLLSIAEAWATRPPLWADVLDRLQAAAPKARIEVWNYADYAAHWPVLHRALAGIDLPHMPDTGRPTRTRTPSAAAIAAAERLDLPAGRARAERVREIYAADIAAGAEPRFDPLGDHHKQALRAAFAHDLAEIERRFPGALRRF